MIIKGALKSPNWEKLEEDDFENVFKYFVDRKWPDRIACVECPELVLEVIHHDCLWSVIVYAIYCYVPIFLSNWICSFGIILFSKKKKKKFRDYSQKNIYINKKRERENNVCWRWLYVKFWQVICWDLMCQSIFLQ